MYLGRAVESYMNFFIGYHALFIYVEKGKLSINTQIEVLSASFFGTAVTNNVYGQRLSA